MQRRCSTSALSADARDARLEHFISLPGVFAGIEAIQAGAPGHAEPPLTVQAPGARRSAQ
jgi:hypothetical protein